MDAITIRNTTLATGMSNKSRRCALALLRGLLVLGGLAGLLWSAAVLPAFWRILPARDTTARIIADDRFKAGTLADVLAKVESEPDVAFVEPEMRRSIALIWLRRMEQAIVRSSSEDADREIATAE